VISRANFYFSLLELDIIVKFSGCGQHFSNVGLVILKVAFKDGLVQVLQSAFNYVVIDELSLQLISVGVPKGALAVLFVFLESSLEEVSVRALNHSAVVVLYTVFELTNVNLSVGDSFAFAVSLAVFYGTCVHPLGACEICHFDFGVRQVRLAPGKDSLHGAFDRGLGLLVIVDKVNESHRENDSAVVLRSKLFQVFKVLGPKAGVPHHSVSWLAAKGDRHQFFVFVSLLNGLVNLVESFVYPFSLRVLKVHLFLFGDFFSCVDRLSAAVEECDDVRVFIQTEISDLSFEWEHVLFEVLLVDNHVGLVFYFAVARVVEEEKESFVALDSGVGLFKEVFE